MTKALPSSSTANAGTALAVRGSHAQLIGDWHAYLDIKARAMEISQNTVNTYKAGLRRFVDFLNTGQRIARPTPEDVRLWKEFQLTVADSKPEAVNTWLSGVRNFYKWAVDQGRIAEDADPTKDVKGAGRGRTKKTHKREALSEDEVRRLLSLDCPAKPKAMLALKVYTGIRDISLLWADLAHLTIRDGHRVLMVRHKGHVEADRLVKITPACWAYLQPWLTQRGRDPGPLFWSESKRNYHGRMDASTVRWMIKELYKAAKVDPSKSSHSARHAAATTALRGGADIRQVQEMMGHEDLNTTMIYAHDLSRLEHAAEDAITY